MCVYTLGSKAFAFRQLTVYISTQRFPAFAINNRSLSQSLHSLIHIHLFTVSDAESESITHTHTLNTYSLTASETHLQLAIHSPTNACRNQYGRSHPLSLHTHSLCLLLSVSPSLIHTLAISFEIRVNNLRQRTAHSEYRIRKRRTFDRTPPASREHSYLEKKI